MNISCRCEPLKRAQLGCACPAGNERARQYEEKQRAKHEVKIAKAERERIITLLKSIKPGCECDDCEKPAAEARTYLDHIIALIKGEEQ